MMKQATRFIICKNCGKEKKLSRNRDYLESGNFCSRICNGIYHRGDKEEQRRKHNLRVRAYYHAVIAPRLKKKREENQIKKEEFRKSRERRIAFEKLRIKKQREDALIATRTFVCKRCQKTFISSYSKKVRIYCSKTCKDNAATLHNPKKKYPSKGISRELFNKVKEKFDYRCAHCGEKEPFLNQYWQYLTQDHIIPRSKGGKKRSIENIQPLCWDCNIKKSNKLENGL